MSPSHPSELPAIPPLISGGIMLSYRCTSACRHCLYRCSPRQPDEWISLETARGIFEALQREPALDSIHLAGGEPTMKPDLLLAVIRLAVEMGMPLTYVETNGAWCRDADTARAGMRRLRDAGLPSILVSASPFHHEFIPFRFTRHCVSAAREVFGPGRVIVYMSHVYDLLARLPDDGTHTLDEFRRLAGLGERPDALLRVYDVIAGGRAARALRACYRPQPADAFRGASCRDELLSTTHFHIDHEGRLFTGLCAGLVAATAENLHPAISAGTQPLFCRLCDGGPCALAELAQAECGFTPSPEGYVSKCDLCLDARGALAATGRFEELKPAAFYLAP